MDPHADARALLAQMLSATGLTHREFSALRGIAERTINAHNTTGKIPATSRDWLRRVREIRAEKGRAVLVIDMPWSAGEGGSYVRDDVTKIHVGKRKAPG
jgi:hypothetical protein